MGTNGTTVLLGVAARIHCVCVLFIRGLRRMSVRCRGLRSWERVHGALKSVVASYVCWLRGHCRELDVGLPLHYSTVACWNRHLYVLAETDVLKISLATGGVVDRIAHPCTRHLPMYSHPTAAGIVDITMHLAVTAGGSLAIAHRDDEHRYVAFRCPHTGVWSHTLIPGEPGHKCAKLVVTEDSIAIEVSTWAVGAHIFRVVDRHTQAVFYSRSTWLTHGSLDVLLFAALENEHSTVNTDTCSVWLCVTGLSYPYAPRPVCKMVRRRDFRVIRQWDTILALGPFVMLMGDCMEPPTIVTVLSGGDSRLCVLE